MEQLVKKPCSNCDKMELQSLIFSKDYYGLKRAQRWITMHGLKGTVVEEKPNTIRFRQEDPSTFSKNSFRTVAITQGLSGVFAKRKETKYSEGGDVLSDDNAPFPHPSGASAILALLGGTLIREIGAADFDLSGGQSEYPELKFSTFSEGIENKFIVASMPDETFSLTLSSFKFVGFTNVQRRLQSFTSISLHNLRVLLYELSIKKP